MIWQSSWDKAGFDGFDTCSGCSPVNRVTLLNTYDCYTKFIFHRDATLHYTSKSNLYFFEVPSICSSKKISHQVSIYSKLCKFLFFFSDTVRCISSCIKIDNCVEFNGRSNVSTNSREMIFRTQELNSFEDENDSFIMDVI